MFTWFKKRRRARITAKPFPDAWRDFIHSRMPYIKCLPPELQLDLEKRIQIFLAEKHFEGCGGFVITEEVRLVIAAQACVLVIGRPIDIFPRLKTILVYKTAFFADRNEEDEIGVVGSSDDVHAGESWDIGVVILAWQEIERGLRHKHDGYNVIIHEFAHQLDQENYETDGVPLLDHRDHYPRWQEVFSEHYAELLNDVERRRKTVLDDYGATNPAEFFAVASESFFEESAKLKQQHPDLYDVLNHYYKQDPAQYWDNARS